MGRISFEEKAVLICFISAAFLWLFRSDITVGTFTLPPGWSGIFPASVYINDGTVAIFIAIVLFIIPTRHKSQKRIMTWKIAEGLPWHIILLFGGGFALAAGIKESGCRLGLVTSCCGFRTIIH